MVRIIALTAVFFIGSTLLEGAQSETGSASKSPNTAARDFIEELGSMLKTIPDTKEDCQALLKRIKSWQEDKLKKLDRVLPKLQITEPKDQSEVESRPIITGIVSDPSAQVWIVIHPMEGGEYWVQPPPNVRRDGSWRVMIHVGREGSIDVGKRFEIMAFGNARVRQRVGDVLLRWPEATWKSQLIEVIRK